VDIPEGAWHLPNPQATDAGAEVRRYEGLIDASGGIDLAILGVGANGHLAFNEPGDTLTGTTHVAALADDTWLRNFPSLAPRLKDEPELRARYSTAYTVGIGTILRARKILVLASGMAKASILASAVRGAITPRNPASFLQLHPDVTFILDEAAGSWVHYTA
jgi:glucosamine-6-phosphate deaminase